MCTYIYIYIYIHDSTCCMVINPMPWAMDTMPSGSIPMKPVQTSLTFADTMAITFISQQIGFLGEKTHIPNDFFNLFHGFSRENHGDNPYGFPGNLP